MPVIYARVSTTRQAEADLSLPDQIKQLHDYCERKQWAVVEKLLPKPQLRGLYHVAADPISKLDLLGLIASVYGKTIDIVPDNAVAVDRSLDGSRFSAETGYVAAAWPRLVESMHSTRHLG